MPDYRLLQKLRPILSHDKKEIHYKSTDKSERHGLRTKTAIVRGFPSVFFCTTSADVDEQESTRLILISPSTAQEKIDEALQLLALRKGNWDKYQREVLEDPKRAWLSKRIKAIRQTRVRHIILPEDGKGLYQEFKDTHAYLQPRHQRDFPRIISLVKAHALLNVFNRQRITEIAIVATEEDIKAGLELYKNIESSNEIGLSPYAYEIYDKAIKPILDPNEPITRKDIRQQFYKVFRRTIPEKQESTILSQLEAAGLILQEPDPKDRRRTLIFYPTHRAGIFSESDTSTDPKKKAEDGAAMTKEILEKYIRQMCGVSEEKAREILANFGNGKKEENEEGSRKNLKAHDAAGGNDPAHDTTATPHTERIHHDDDVTLCRICGCILRSEQELSDHMSLIHSIFADEGADS
jgi:DNA-binding MarR family transcriptional regulator